MLDGDPETVKVGIELGFCDGYPVGDLECSKLGLAEFELETIADGYAEGKLVGTADGCSEFNRLGSVETKSLG